MDDISFKDIRVLPNQLDLKSNTGKTLADLVPQLQSGAVLKGLVVGSTLKGEIIFHTALGRFISPNPMGLERGDTITIRLARHGEVLSGKIVKVNNANPDIKEPISLAFIKEPKASKVVPNANSAATRNIDFQNSGKMPEIITGKITYVNMSKLGASTQLYKAITAHIKPDAANIPIELKTVVNKSALPTTLTITGQVAAERSQGKQMIKTDFGIITTENTKLAAGQKVHLSILSINNQVIRDSGKEALAEFIFKVNKSWSSLKKVDPSNIVATRKMLKSEQASSQNLRISGKEVKGHVMSVNGKVATGAMSRSSIPTPEGSLQQAASMLRAETVTSSGKTVQLSNPPPAQVGDSPIKENRAVQQDSKAPIKLDAQIQSNTVLDEMSNVKLGKELTNLGAVMSTIRKGTRRLNSNADMEEMEQVRAKLSDSKEAAATKTATKSKPLSTGLNNILKSFSDMEAIKKVAYELSQIKEAFSMNTLPVDDHENWYSVHIPMHYNEQVNEQEICISSPKKGFVRFVVNSNFETIGEFQLDGLVQFESSNRKAKNFDLIVRLKNRMDQELSRSISDIFIANQKITGMRGSMHFENDSDYPSLPKLD